MQSPSARSCVRLCCALIGVRGFSWVGISCTNQQIGAEVGLFVRDAEQVNLVRKHAFFFFLEALEVSYIHDFPPYIFSVDFSTFAGSLQARAGTSIRKRRASSTQRACVDAVWVGVTSFARNTKNVSTGTILHHQGVWISFNVD